MCLMFLFIFSESSRAEVGGQRLGGGGGGGGGALLGLILYLPLFLRCRTSFNGEESNDCNLRVFLEFTNF